MHNRLTQTLAFLFLLLPAATPAATVYRFAGDRLSGVYQLKVNGDDVPVTAFPDVNRPPTRVSPPPTARPPNGSPRPPASSAFIMPTWHVRANSRSN